MRMFIASLLLLAGLGGAGQALAAIDVYTFDSDAQEQTFRELTKELRCPVPEPGYRRLQRGPGQDLRDKTYQMVREGRTSRKWWTTWSPATATSSCTIRR